MCLLQEGSLVLGTQGIQGGSVYRPSKGREGCSLANTNFHTRSLAVPLGLALYYCKFIQNFASIARLLWHLTERGRAFAWTTECANSFAVLKQWLTSALILIFPYCFKPFILDMDASQDGIGAVLSQTHEGSERVVANY